MKPVGDPQKVQGLERVQSGKEDAQAPRELRVPSSSESIAAE